MHTFNHLVWKDYQKMSEKVTQSPSLGRLLYMCRHGFPAEIHCPVSITEHITLLKVLNMLHVYQNVVAMEILILPTAVQVHVGFKEMFGTQIVADEFQEKSETFGEIS